MPEELSNRRHLRNGSCAHLAQADRSSWTNPDTELLLSPAPGRRQRHSGGSRTGRGNIQEFVYNRI
jgi:hypothetical protein